MIASKEYECGVDVKWCVVDLRPLREVDDPVAHALLYV
jgi:hypothetical protein